MGHQERSDQTTELLNDIERYLAAKGDQQAENTGGFVCAECTKLLSRVRDALGVRGGLLTAARHVSTHTVADGLGYRLTFPYDPQFINGALADAEEFEDQS